MFSDQKNRCLLLSVVHLPGGATVRLDEFLEKINAVEVQVLESESIYETIVEVMIEQPLDHRNPDGEKFAQRLYISHIDPSRPVVFVTAGYDAKYYYTSEILAEAGPTVWTGGTWIPGRLLRTITVSFRSSGNYTRKNGSRPVSAREDRL